MEFPRLRELLLSLGENETIYKSDCLQILNSLPSKLKALRMTGPSYTRKGITASFLRNLAGKCPNLKEVWLAIPRASIMPSDLALFFQTIRPREVCLDFVRRRDVLITHNVLTALSDSGCLEVLGVGYKDESRADVKAAQLQHFYEKTANPFPSLKELRLCGVFHLGHLVGSNLVFEDLEDLQFDAVITDFTASKAARVINTFAPRLRWLSPASCTRAIVEIRNCFMDLYRPGVMK